MSLATPSEPVEHGLAPGRPRPFPEGADARALLPIEGMTCASCAARLEKVLGRAEGVVEASVSFTSEAAQVAYDSEKIGPVALAGAVERAGYHVPMHRARLRVRGMTCASCAARIEKALRQRPEVAAANVSLAQEVATVAWPEGATDEATIVRAIERLGYGAETDSREQDALRAERQRRQQEWQRDLGMLVLAAFLTGPLLLPMLMMPLGIMLHLPGWLQVLLATPVQVILGWGFYRGGFRALRSGSANMDVLVSLGTTAAFGLSLVLWIQGNQELYFESAAAILTFVRLGKFLEKRAKQRTGAAVESLLALERKSARVQRGDTEVEVPTDAVGVGEVVLVRPGETIPVDGRVLGGAGHVDEALITGESRPVAKGPGDEVVGGSTNQEGALRVEVTRTGGATALARIIELVQNAQASKARVQATVDRVSAVFVPAVLVAALLTGLAWALAGAGADRALLASVAVLVIACPCALGLATPTALIVGMGVAARRGILIQDALALETAHAVNTVVFDKTGTLTVGRPRVQGALALGNEAEVWRLAASAERGSQHPLASALRAWAEERRLVTELPEKFEALHGRGLVARVAGHEVVIGNERLMTERGVVVSDAGGCVAGMAGSEQERASAAAEAWEAEGYSVVRIAIDGAWRGVVALGDEPRPTAAAAIAALQAAGVETLMLSGDHRTAAEAMARRLGLSRVIAEVSPADKAAQVRALQQGGRKVAMVGDGVNDAPALAAADLGVALGTGTDVAIKTAAVTLLRPEPLLVADALTLSRATLRKIQQNLFFAFVYNTVGIPLAAFGLLTPMLAGAAMAMSSVSVVTNALLLRRWKGAGAGGN